jgi:hypothetical protein
MRMPSLRAHTLNCVREAGAVGRDQVRQSAFMGVPSEPKRITGRVISQETTQ